MLLQALVSSVCSLFRAAFLRTVSVRKWIGRLGLVASSRKSMVAESWFTNRNGLALDAHTRWFFQKLAWCLSFYTGFCYLLRRQAAIFLSCRAYFWWIRASVTDRRFDHRLHLVLKQSKLLLSSIRELLRHQESAICSPLDLIPSFSLSIDDLSNQLQYESCLESAWISGWVWRLRRLFSSDSVQNIGKKVVSMYDCSFNVWLFDQKVFIFEFLQLF